MAESIDNPTAVKLRSGIEYDHLIPKAKVIDKTVKMGATVADTVEFIPMVVRKSAWQAKTFVDHELRGLPTYQALEKLWFFLKHHIEFKKDERGYEQVRTFRRLWHDKLADCDCFTTTIDTCLYALQAPDIVKVVNRITKYKADHFQHIYPIVYLANGQRIVMDVVLSRFNYEEPYTEKKDFTMDLQVLDGIDEKELALLGIDAQDLLGYENDLGELGKLLKKGGAKKVFQKVAQKVQTTTKKATQQVKVAAKKAGTVAKKALHVVNRVNPATVLLRAGVLASMKLNLMNVAGQLKYGYLTDAQAQAKGVDMGRFAKLKNVLKKLEQIFHGAGGKPENLKQAILSGKGNPNKEVSGLGLIDPYRTSLEGLGAHASLPELLGLEVYNGEFVDGLEGVEGLGEPATASAIAAASGAIAAIAGLLKSIGSIFPKKKQEAAAENPAATETPTVTETSAETPTPESPEPVVTNPAEAENGGATVTDSNTPNPAAPSGGNAGGGGEENTSIEPSTTNPAAKGVAPPATSKAGGFKEFYDKNKKWIKPVGIGLGTAVVLYIGYRIIKSTKTPVPAPAINGVEDEKQEKKQKQKKVKSADTVGVIKLM